MKCSDRGMERMMAEIDEGLFQQAVEGDADAFWRLVLPFRRLVYSVALGLLKSPEAAEDLVHDVLVKAFRTLHNLRKPGSLPSWLYSMTRNLAMDQMRRERRLRVSIHGGAPELMRVVPMAELLEKERWLTLMEEGIARLPEPFRVVLSLKYMNDFNCRDMAEVLDTSVAAVKSRLFQARKALRKITEQLAVEQGGAQDEMS